MCQASGVGYVFTYEINYLRDSSCNHIFNDSINQYPPGFTYNYLNKGDWLEDSQTVDGWEILQEMGCPNLKNYGGLHILPAFTNWMTGYDKYYGALCHKVDSMAKVNITNPNGLLLLKQWLFNHNNDTAQYGGLASFGTNTYACVYDTIRSGPNTGKSIVADWQNPFKGNHQMTFVGYNDSIRYDYNNDGLYTNSIDINEDDTVDMKDWEWGALKVANSWGITYYIDNDSGYVYWPYRLLAYDSVMVGNDKYEVIIDSIALMVYPKKTYQPELTIRTKMKHDERNRLQFKVDYGIDADSDPPETATYEYKALTFNGGPNPMQGKTIYDPIEIELDYHYFFNNLDTIGKVFMDIWQSNPNWYNGYLYEFAIVDYRWNEVFELMADYSSDSITFQHNWYSIDYDLIPFTIDSNLLLYSNMVSRFEPTVSNNAILTIDDNVIIDMYDSEIIIEEGSSLIIGDNVIFNGKNGENKLTINGNISIGNNVSFNAIDEIQLNNSNLQTTFNNATFTDTTILKNYGESVSIDSSLFENCMGMYSFASDVDISNTRFVNSSVVVSNSEETSTHTIYVEYNEFDNANQNTMAAVKLMCCDKFFIEGNDISGYDKGIEAWYSGEGTTGNQSIYNNDIADTENGILLYNTIASVAGNNVYENDYGVKFLSRSNVAFMGDPNDGVQYITDNDSYEVYASEESFPWYFRYNEIVDEDNSGNPNDPLVYHNSEDDSLRDVRYNCWGTNFVDTLDLYPAGGYTWSPDYCSKKSSIYSGPDEELYTHALANFETGNYDSAQILYDSLVGNYNSSAYSKAALKDMFALEQFTGNQYESLRSWYRTNDSILADSSLRRLADYLANKCDIELGFYQTAFSWYDSVIFNPYTFEDSIFAVIDRDFLSLQTGSNALKEITYNLQGIPNSYDEFKLKSDYLISLLPGERKDEEELNKGMVGTSIAKIIYVVPNPARDVAEMEFELSRKGHVFLEVYDYSGKKITSIDKGSQTEGIHTIRLNLKNFKSGLYLVSLYFNDKLEGSVKLSVY